MKTLAVDQVLDGSIYNPVNKKHVPVHRYHVTKVTNSVTPKIGDALSVDKLNVYCESDEWSVTIK